MMTLKASDLLGAYALGAVDRRERALVERAVAKDAEMRSELDSLMRVVDVLDDLTAEQVPVAGSALWKRIEAATAADTEPGSHRHRKPRRSFSKPRLPRRSIWNRVAAPVAVAAVLAVVLLSALVVRLGADNRSLEAALEDPVAYAADRAISDPTSETVQLTAPGAAGEPITVEAVYRTDGTGYVIGDSLPALGPERTYQLWAVVGDRVISAGVLGASPGIAPFQVVGELTGLAITEEIPGGVVSSDNDPVAVWLAGT